MRGEWATDVAYCLAAVWRAGPHSVLVQMAVGVAQDGGAAAGHLEHFVVELRSGVSVLGAEGDVAPVAEEEHERHVCGLRGVEYETELWFGKMKSGGTCM